MLTLYHFGFSTCSQKVRLVLAEKGLDFESHEVDLMTGAQHDAEYVRLNPNHVVPTLVHDDRVLIESSLIIKYLDNAFPQPPMREVDATGRYETDTWLKYADDVLHRAAPTVTFAIGPRKGILAQPAGVREATIEGIQDPIQRATRRSVLEHGVHAPEFRGALDVFIDTLDRMEGELASRPWLAGQGFGLVDATLLPYVLRLEHLSMDPLLDASVRPRVADWLHRVKALPSYGTAVDAWIVAPALSMLRTNGKEAWPLVEALLSQEVAG